MYKLDFIKTEVKRFITSGSLFTMATIMLGRALQRSFKQINVTVRMHSKSNVAVIMLNYILSEIFHMHCRSSKFYSCSLDHILNLDMGPYRTMIFHLRCFQLMDTQFSHSLKITSLNRLLNHLYT